VTTQLYFRAAVRAHRDVMPEVVGSRNGFICFKERKL